jgi:hypothetical protein
MVAMWLIQQYFQRHASIFSSILRKAIELCSLNGFCSRRCDVR